MVGVFIEFGAALIAFGRLPLGGLRRRCFLAHAADRTGALFAVRPDVQAGRVEAFALVRCLSATLDVVAPRKWRRDRSDQAIGREIGDAITQSLGGKPDWAMSARLFAAEWGLLEGRLMAYLKAIETGDDDVAAATAENVAEFARKAIEFAKPVPIPQTSECVRALEHIANAVENRHLPNKVALEVVDEFVRLTYH